MTLQLIPEADALIAAWLREHPAIIALDANVAGKLPDSIVKPWIRVTLLDATDDVVSGAEHLIEFFLQLDCYAGKAASDADEGQGEASTLARTARAVLKATQGTSSGGVVVSKVTFSGMLRLPDTTMEPARERYVLDVTVSLHGA